MGNRKMLERVAIYFGFPDTHPGWERAVILFLTTIILVVPPLVVEFYPLSSFPMFSDAPRSRVFSTANDSVGESISLSRVGINDLYLGNPNPLVNLKPQRPIDAAYRFWSIDEFAPYIQEALRTEKVIGPISFTQELVGAKPNGKLMSVGVIEKRTWRITSTEIQPVDK